MDKELDMLEYEFERVHAEMGGYSIFGGIGIETEGHREVIPVSYTHLDVYKRQSPRWRASCSSSWR